MSIAYHVKLLDIMLNMPHIVLKGANVMMNALNIRELQNIL